ncbi:MAG: DoxX-like family protein [Ottowia sp.]
MPEPQPLALLRYSLVAVWLWTAVVSVAELHGQSRQLLEAASVVPAHWFSPLVWAGAALDAVLGLMLWAYPRRAVIALMATSVLLMTAVATWLLPDLWWHPLGPLSKNLPLLAALYLLWKEARA